MIVDIVYFFDELDLLEIRLNMYDDIVDLFVIIDSTRTFAGKEHRPILLDHKTRFHRWWDRIKLIIVDDFPENKLIISEAIKNSNIGSGEHYWIREFYIKEYARQAFDLFSDSDILFVSDVDEFWDPVRINSLVSAPYGVFVRPVQKAIYYYFNLRCNELNGWTGTVVGRCRDWRTRWVNDVRTRAKTKCLEVPCAGWHFGFIVGLDGFQGEHNKMTRRTHPEYNRWIKDFSENVRSFRDYRGRDYKYWLDDENLPEFLLANKKKYAQSFFNP